MATSSARALRAWPSEADGRGSLIGAMDSGVARGLEMECALANRGRFVHNAWMEALSFLFDLIGGIFALVDHWRFFCGAILAALAITACYAFIPEPWRLVAAIPVGLLYFGGGVYF